MSDVAEVDQVRTTAEYKRMKKLLSDREWRLDNLYFIRDEDGNTVKFVRNEAQRHYSGEMHSRDLIPKARKLGFSTFIAVLICDTCMFRSGTVGGIVDRTMDDAEEKLKIIKFAFEHLPADLRAANPLLRSNQRELEWANGSNVSVGTTYRGGTPSILHISEYGKVSIDSPDSAKEIKTGAIQAVPASGKVFNESTAHGTGGEFCAMVKTAEKKQLEGGPLTALDWKLHFYGWWIKKEYRLPNNLVVVSQQLREYFEELHLKHKLWLDADQRAWYAKKHEELGPDDVKQEFPSIISELFYNSLQGAFFRSEMIRARKDGRVGQMVPFDPTRRVNTAWDIGEDCTAVLFHQTDGLRHRFIDYYEEEGGSLQSAIAAVHDKAATRKFIYEKHFGPHDLDHRVWTQNAQSRKATAKGLGVDFTVVPQVAVKGDSIEAFRRMLNLSWIDQEHCALWVERLDNYRKRWNKLLGVFSSDPIHDMSSHGADAGQQIAMGLAPEKVSRESRNGRGSDKPKASAWGA